MKGIAIRVVLCAALLFGGVTVAPAANDGGNVPSAVTPQVQELQQKMLGDPGIMALVMALQNDPEMQVLLNDPKVAAAVQAGDMGTLLSDPRIMKLLDDPRVREIGERLSAPKAGQ